MNAVFRKRPSSRRTIDSALQGSSERRPKKSVNTQLSCTQSSQEVSHSEIEVGTKLTPLGPAVGRLLIADIGAPIGLLLDTTEGVAEGPLLESDEGTEDGLLLGIELRRPIVTDGDTLLEDGPTEGSLGPVLGIPLSVVDGETEGSLIGKEDGNRT